MKPIIITLALILAPGGVVIAGGDSTRVEIHRVLDSTVPAFFLNAQLFTKGLFKTIYPF